MHTHANAHTSMHMGAEASNPGGFNLASVTGVIEEPPRAFLEVLP